MLRRIELVTGFAASVVGILGLGYAMLGRTYRYTRIAISSDGKANTMSGTISLVQKGLEPSRIGFFIITLLIAVSFAAGTYWHSHRGVKAALLLLWTLTALLWIAVVLGAASIGVLLLPAALLAVVTVATGSLAHAPRGTAGNRSGGLANHKERGHRL